MERQEVRALLALDVDHLDELAGLHLVAEGRRPVDPEVQARVGERGGELDLLGVARARSGGPRRPGPTAGRRPRPRAARRGRRRRDAVALGAERLLGARRRPLAEQPDRHRVRRVAARRPASVRTTSAAPSDRRGDQRPARRSRARRRRARAPRPSSEPSGASSVSSAVLAAVAVVDGEPVVGARARGRSRRPAAPSTARGRGPAELSPGPGGFGGPAGDRHASQPFARRVPCDSCFVGLLDSSCSASSRFPAASSFFTSFSTARRLYDWFQ